MVEANEKEPISKRLVAFKDCDAFGMLYNTRYLDYVMDARSEQLINYYGIDYYAASLKSMSAFVVQGHAMAYFEPTGVHENIVVRTRIIQVGQKSMTFEGQILDADQRRLKYLQWTKMVNVDMATGAPVPLRDEDRNDLDRWRAVEDLPETEVFDERVKALRSRFSKE